jgi:hypothetical protein
MSSKSEFIFAKKKPAEAGLLVKLKLTNCIVVLEATNSYEHRGTA